MIRSVKDFSFLAFSNFSLKILGLISLVIYTRVLLKEELAIVPIHSLLSRLSMVMFSLGVLPCLVKLIPSLLIKKDQFTVNAIIKTCLILVVPGVFIFSLGCYFFANSISLFIFDSHDNSRYIELLAVGVFFEGISQLLSYVYWSLSMFKQESMRMILVGLIKVITGVVLVLYIGTWGLIISLVISSFINFLIYTYNLRKIIFTRSKMYSIRKLLSESWPFYFESYLMYFRAEGDQLVVTTFLGAEALAIYYIARRPFEFMRTLTQSLEKVLTTKLAELKDDKSSFSQQINTIITINSFILLPVVFLTIGITPTFLDILGGGSYDASIIPAIILLLTLLVQFFWNSTFGRSIFILTSSVNRFKMTTIETGLLFVFILIFGYLYDLNGIVSARLVATTLTGFCAYLLVKSYLTLNFRIKQIVIILLLSLAMVSILLVGQILFSNYITLALIGILAVGFFLVGITLSISDEFYGIINRFIPFNIQDPLKFLFRKFL